MNENGKQQPLWRGWIKNLIFLAIGLVLLSFIAPLVLTQLTSLIEFNADTGAIGDTIGGIVNPFIALAGVIVTGLAFYMQLKANEIQINNFQTELQNQKETFQKQLEIQKEDNRFNQFESQFYEMLRLHKENVNEIEIDLYVYTENKIYNTEKQNSRNLLASRSPITEKHRQIKTIKGRDVFLYFSNELNFAYKIYMNFLGNRLQFFNFSIPYSAFFNGLSSMHESDYKTSIIDNKGDFERNFLNDNPAGTKFLDIEIRSNYILFEGHENKLGHYYRHLYHTVKYVAIENDFLTYTEKRKYLRILRAQLSNYEQAMLFYNYLAVAPEWEIENKFLSDFRMIHNLYKEILIPDEYFMKEYDNIKNSQSTAQVYKEKDYIFESQKWDF